MKKIVLGFSCLLLAAGPVLAQTFFRCNGQLVDLGAAAGDVLALCGEPSQVAEGSDEIGEGVAIPVEEWLYRDNPDGPAILIFRNGRLAEMRTLDGIPPT